MRKLDQLTFTRFLAALAVVLFHSGDVYPVTVFPLNPLFTSGQTAVSYFFVLSGFVMAIVYYRPGERFDFWGFWKARFTRIYPVYILAFLLTCLFYVDIMAKVKTNKILANIFLAQAWYPQYAESFNVAAWSLSVEMFFYALFPFLAVLAYRLSARTLIWISIAVWIISQGWQMGLYQHWYMDFPRNFSEYFPPVHLSSFLLGMAGGIWFLSKRDDTPRQPGASRILLMLALFLVGAALIARHLSPRLDGSLSLDAGLLAPFFLVIIICLAADQSSLTARLSDPRLLLLGDASYALYILHLPVRWIGERWAASNGVPYPFFIYIYWIVMVVVSILVFLKIERPARDWLRQNFGAMRLVIVDVAIILGCVYLANVLRFSGRSFRDYEESIRFMGRLGLTAYLAGLIAWRLYEPGSHGTPPRLILRIFAAIGLGAAILTGGMFVAANAAWIEGFSRSTILISSLLIALLAFTVRAAFPGPKRKLPA